MNKEETKFFVNKIKDMHSVFDKEGIFLYDTAKNCSRGVIVEIGAWKGVSAIWLGSGSNAGNKMKVYSIDTFTGSQIHKKKYGNIETLTAFQKNIDDASLTDIICPIAKESEEAIKEWTEPIEFLWIDGNHEYESVKKDFSLWFSHLIKNGTIALHDSAFRKESGPVRVVREEIQTSKRFINIGTVGSITFATKI